MKNAFLFFVVSTILTAPQAEVIYENSEDYEGKPNDSRLEYGDEITLAGSARLLTQFAFEYFGAFATTGDESARMRFYYNDAPELGDSRPPGKLFLDTGEFSIQSGFRTVRVGLDSFLHANSLTWTVKFSGLATNETAGLLFYSPVSIGSSGNFYWENSTNGWEKISRADSGNNFGAQLQAQLASKIEKINQQGGTNTVTAGVVLGKEYALEFSRTLAAGSWAPVSTNFVRATSLDLTLQDSAAGQESARFYRLVER